MGYPDQIKPRRLKSPMFSPAERSFTKPLEHHSAKILRAENLRALGFDPTGANADLIDPVHQLGDEMKLKAGVAKRRDLPFRRENNLRILNGVFDVVLFQIMWATIRRRRREFQKW